MVQHGSRGTGGGLAVGEVVRGDLQLVHTAILLLVASYVPLLIVGVLDPRANPIGLGLLAMLGTAAAVLILGCAVLRAVPRACGINQ